MLTKIEERSAKLFNLGLKFNGSDFIKDDFNVHWTEVSCDTDEEFNKKVSLIKTEMTRRIKKS